MHDYSNIPVIPALLAAAGACAGAALLAHRRPRISGPREPKLWAMLALLFLAFVALKTLGVVEVVEDATRDRIRAEGMYGERRIIQVTIVLAAAIFGVAQSIWYGKHIAHRWKRYRWTLIGAVVIVCFAVMRAVSLHELDALGPALTVAKVVIEIAASLLAAWGAWCRARELRGGPPSRLFDGKLLRRRDAQTPAARAE